MSVNKIKNSLSYRSSVLILNKKEEFTFDEICIEIAEDLNCKEVNQDIKEYVHTKIELLKSSGSLIQFGSYYQVR